MKKGSKKSPLQPRSKEQIVRDDEIARKRKIVVEKFFPALVDSTTSVDEAKMLLQSLSSLLMEDVLGTMKERHFSDISKRLVKVLTPNDERLLEIEKLLGVLERENLFVAREIIEGMSRAIEQMVLEDMQGRKLDSLKADWSRYLN